MKEIAEQFRLEFMKPPINPKPAKFFQVGGSVRDKILGVPSKDIDYAVETESFDTMRDAILARGGKIFLETPQYFTIRAHVPELGATDYVLCRKDGEYKDGRRPETVTAGTIWDDLARRDFTCNAIAIDTQTGETLDPHCGIQDIESKMIRCVGNPVTRFQEDRLRVYRAVRFAVTKNFRIHPETNAAIIELVDNGFDAVSTERIREELLKMLQVNTWMTFNFIGIKYPWLLNMASQRGIWFKPTTEAGYKYGLTK